MSLEEIIVDCLEKVCAKDILVYDTKERSPFYDEMILASVDSNRLASSVIAYFEDECAKNGFDVRSIEGRESAWVLIDCHSVIVSIFTKEEREHFAIEKIYMDVPVKKVN
jgi:ribosome-associated protein